MTQGVWRADGWVRLRKLVWVDREDFAVRFSVDPAAVRREAEFSRCRAYRYRLRIVWDERLPVAGFVGLNPSTADELRDDPTVRRCRGFAERWGCGGLLMLNLFSFRATLPAVMKAHPEPVGRRRNRLHRLIEECDGPWVACWGVHGAHLGRGVAVARTIPRLRCLGVNADGSPKHPLYLRGDARLVEFRQVGG